MLKIAVLVSGGGTKWVTVDCAKTGYTLVGSAGYYIDGSVSFNIYAMYPSGNNMTFALRNTASSAQSATVKVYALYVKND